LFTRGGKIGHEPAGGKEGKNHRKQPGERSGAPSKPGIKGRSNSIRAGTRKGRQIDVCRRVTRMHAGRGEPVEYEFVQGGKREAKGSSKRRIPKPKEKLAAVTKKERGKGMWCEKKGTPTAAIKKKVSDLLQWVEKKKESFTVR